MFNQTLHALEAFDNSHDFERMCSDILNALGYSGVTPSAPGGGGDDGQDIHFREGEVEGTALVTLNKKIADKYRFDLKKQPPTTNGLLALFCTVTVSPQQKFAFTQEAMAKGYRLEVFDIERLRSLLDGSLTSIRRHYLHIDDAIALQIRSETAKLIRFPKAYPDSSRPQTILEQLLTNKLPRQLFELLMQFNEKDIQEVPVVGSALHKHLSDYYSFQEGLISLESELMSKIGTMVSVRFRQGWAIYLKYCLLRFCGRDPQEIQGGGNFLNYEITWQDAERVYQTLAGDALIGMRMHGLLNAHGDMNSAVQGLT